MISCMLNHFLDRDGLHQVGAHVGSSRQAVLSVISFYILMSYNEKTMIISVLGSGQKGS